MYILLGFVALHDFIGTVFEKKMLMARLLQLGADFNVFQAEVRKVM